MIYVYISHPKRCNKSGQVETQVGVKGLESCKKCFRDSKYHVLHKGIVHILKHEWPHRMVKRKKEDNDNKNTDYLGACVPERRDILV